MKNKLLFSGLILSLVFSFTACSGNSKTASAESTPTVQTEEEKDDTITEPEEEPAKPAEDTAKEETEVTANTDLSDDLYSFQLQIDDTVYQFPMTYAEFTANGWVASDDETESLTPDSYGFFYFKKDSWEISSYIYNGGISAKPASECSIAGISIDEFSMQNSTAKILLPKGITYGVSTKEDVIEAYGDPSDTYEGDLYTQMTYTQDYYEEVTIEVSTETNLVNAIKIQNLVSDQSANEEEAATVSDSEIAEVTAYQAPTELGDDLLSFIAEYDGTLYHLPAPVSEFVKNGWTVDDSESDSVIKGSSFGWVYLTKNNQRLSAIAQNYSTDAATINNCFVTTIKGDDNTTDMPITIQKGITRGMSQADLEAALSGIDFEQDDSSSFIYYTIRQPEDSLNYVEIMVRKDTSVVQAIEVSNTPDTLS